MRLFVFSFFKVLQFRASFFSCAKSDENKHIQNNLSWIKSPQESYQMCERIKKEIKLNLKVIPLCTAIIIVSTFRECYVYHFNVAIKKRYFLLLNLFCKQKYETLGDILIRVMYLPEIWVWLNFIFIWKTSPNLYSLVLLTLRCHAKDE